MTKMIKRTFPLVAALVFIAGSVFAATIDLTGTIRDFNDTHPDFEMSSYSAYDGIVDSSLGLDGTPVRIDPNTSTTSDASFYQWYHDDASVNRSKDFTIQLDNTITSDPNVYSYRNDSFFPIDNDLYGNDGRSHNFHFTFEIHSQFTYQGNENFSFTGDDDLWVFINENLAVDLGGVHGAQTEAVDLTTLGLTVGETYAFDLFFAERHTSQSHFNIDTSIVLSQPAPVPEPSTILLLGSGLLGLGWYGRKRKKA